LLEPTLSKWSTADVANTYGRVGLLCAVAALLTAAACEVGPICSDGVVAGEEECDDGNLEDGDGCSSGCQLETPPHFCGDGTLDPGEACDDGNVINSDGCSSTCQFDDDVSTPGDDRAGFLTCTDEAEGTSLTCSRGNGCCSEPTACRPNELDCLSPFWFQTCDGPEDCGAGEQCWSQNQYIGCAAEPDWFFEEVLCHSDADCIVPSLNPCLAGRCEGLPWGLPGYQPACGNGIVDDPELCDDGNTADGDGCSSECLLGLPEDDPSTPGDDRLGFVDCVGPSDPATCGPGLQCCIFEDPTQFQCIDGTEGLDCWSINECDGPEDCNYYAPQCGNIYSTSRCSSSLVGTVRCHTDLDCDKPSENPCIEGTCLAVAPSDPEPICGDGVLAPTEGCDDGNLAEGDGCSSRCQLEDPESLCGNGTIDPDEACDDGNTSPGDGCGSYCQFDDRVDTPGDDRAGFVTCASVSEGVSMTCRPDMGCCSGPTECRPDSAYCQSPFWFRTCDGPEDCPAGAQCWTLNKFIDCAVHPAQTYGGVYCHTDADCVMSAVNPCIEGQCVGEPRDLPGYEPGCGSGSIDPGELCDDGNTEDADGCNSNCRGGLLADDPSTPGDDRSGAVACSGASSITCGLGLNCCLPFDATESVCTSDDQSACGQFAACDGPEDCLVNNVCTDQFGAFLCLPRPFGAVRCHSALDCNEGSVCNDGLCTSVLP
jgi:cysteine-rich repeat protein